MVDVYRLMKSCLHLSTFINAVGPSRRRPFYTASYVVGSVGTRMTASSGLRSPLENLSGCNFCELNGLPIATSTC